MTGLLRKLSRVCSRSKYSQYKWCGTILFVLLLLIGKFQIHKPNIDAAKLHYGTTDRYREPFIPDKSYMEQCSEKRDVSFLKVHKAGSSTVMNIFLRFAINNDLNIVLPYNSSGKGFNYLGYRKTVSKRNIVPLPSSESYNILCNHAVYNKKAFQSIMPEDTVYVGILRSPDSQFKSAANYYGLASFIQRIFRYNTSVNAFDNFLQNPYHHLRYMHPIVVSFLHNPMSFDFGVDPWKFGNMSYVDNYIRQLENDYSLVMIMEHFPESLVLLRRTLCWDTKDIIYVPLNSKRFRPSSVLLTEDKVEQLKYFSHVDFKLYAHFKTIFQYKVNKLGQDFVDEVKSFTKIQKSVESFCNKWKYRRFVSTLNIAATDWGAGFSVSQRDCALITEEELPMMNKLIKNAWRKYHTSLMKDIIN